MTSENEPGDHEAHARGLAAFMATEGFPHNPDSGASDSLRNLLLVSKARSFQAFCTTVSARSNRLRLQVSGVFSIPALNDQNGNLTDLLINLDTLWKTFHTSCEPRDLNTLWNDCIILNQQFTLWEDFRPTAFNPISVGCVKQNPHGVEIATGHWPGKVDTYFDLSVAGVWNIFRAARLLLVALITKLADATGRNDGWIHIQHIANRTMQDMLASIPYHLTDNLQHFLSKVANYNQISEPGKNLGGLLLMHPLFVALKMPFIPKELRDHLRQCLFWIGTNMGLGHAIRLAKVSVARSDPLSPQPVLEV